MKYCCYAEISLLFAIFLGFGTASTTTLSLPQSSNKQSYEAELTSSVFSFPRRAIGGGGGSGGGGSSSSSSSGSRGSSSSSSSSRGSGGTSSTSSSGRGSGGTSSSSSTSSSKTFGSTNSNSGSKGYYSGGASTAFTSFKTSPGGITPISPSSDSLKILSLAFLDSSLADTYEEYDWDEEYWPTIPLNNTDTTSTSSALASSSENRKVPVKCFCKQYGVCGCDQTKDTSYLDDLATAAEMNNTDSVRLLNVNNTLSNAGAVLVVNGTLENGTTVSNGGESDNSSDTGVDTSTYGYGVSDSFGYYENNAGDLVSRVEGTLLVLGLVVGVFSFL